MLRGLIVDYGGVLTDTGETNLAWPADQLGPADLAGPEVGEPALIRVLREVRGRGVRTALLSNADGLGGDRCGLAALFDAVVLSGQVGFGKPDPRIYLLTADRLELRPDQCVFVDDLAVNVRAAATVGMVGVHHRSIETTLTELEVLLELPLGR